MWQRRRDMEKRQCCRCVHGIEADFNSINELIIYCELTGEWMNVNLGNCLGNCESEEDKPWNA
jgi:hypothetical protein